MLLSRIEVCKERGTRSRLFAINLRIGSGTSGRTIREKESSVDGKKKESEGKSPVKVI